MKILIAILMTLILIIGSFVVPPIYVWYCKAYLSNAIGADILPFLMTTFLFIGLGFGTVIAWIKALDS